MSIKGALVIFVKTPGCSPIKTRLAHSIGKTLAEEFYIGCLAATAAYVKAVQMKLPGLAVYWAVAEKEGLESPFWSDFPVIYQGEGNLGIRLSNVYREMLDRHEFACFIGADSPHVQTDQVVLGVLESARALKERFVIGETHDGGFYFFGGSIPVSESLWTSVEYSSPKTTNELRTRLISLGGIATIAKDFDIDTLDDLWRYRERHFDSEEFLPEQANIIRWARSLPFIANSEGKLQNYLNF